MMTGVVNADREPILEVTVRDVNGQDRQREAVVDTGYTGWLTLPPDVIAALGLTPTRGFARCERRFAPAPAKEYPGENDEK